jgi:hypothetical protein
VQHRSSRWGKCGASSVYEDIWTIPSQGESYTLWVWLRQGGPLPQAPTHGSIRLWALPVNNCYVDVPFTLTSATWTLVSATLTVCSGSRTYLRAEIYINDANLNYDIDGVKFFKMN